MSGSHFVFLFLVVFCVLFSGKVAVIGGCREYTGAPYFAAISALKIVNLPPPPLFFVHYAFCLTMLSFNLS
jgi:hypothetical protein